MSARKENDGQESETPTSPSGSRYGVLRQPKIIGEPTEDGDSEDREMAEIQMEEDINRFYRTSRLDTENFYMPSVVAHTVRKSIYACHLGDVMADTEAEYYPHHDALYRNFRSNSEIRDLANTKPNCQHYAQDPSQKRSISFQDLSPQKKFSNDFERFKIVRRAMNAQCKLHRAREIIMRNPGVKLVRIPNAFSDCSLGKRTRTDEKTLQERNDPKEVLMEVLYPGEGKKVLDQIANSGREEKAGLSANFRPCKLRRKGFFFK